MAKMAADKFVRPAEARLTEQGIGSKDVRQQKSPRVPKHSRSKRGEFAHSWSSSPAAEAASVATRSYTVASDALSTCESTASLERASSNLVRVAAGNCRVGIGAVRVGRAAGVRVAGNRGAQGGGR